MQVHKLMVIHASRGRPVRGTVAAQKLIDNMVTQTPFTYFFSLDTDDPTLPRYSRHIDNLGFVTKTLVASNRGSVDAVNNAAKEVTDEDLMFVHGDDLGVPEGWDKLMFDFIAKIPKPEYLVHFNFYPPNSNNCAIIQCISAALFRQMGQFFYREYISMFADNDLFMMAKALDALYVYDGPPIQWVHEHPHYGFPIEMDDTYRRTASPEKFTIGQEIYARREAQGFGVSKP